MHVGMHTVDEVVRGHDSPWVGFADGYLKWLKIQLSQWPFGNEGVNSQSMGLLFVANEVCRCISGYGLGVDA